MKSFWNKLFRWVLFLPLAIICSQLSYNLIILLSNISMNLVGIDPFSFLSKLYVVLVSNLMAGASIVYVSSKVVPSNKKITSYIVASFHIIFCFVGYIYSLKVYKPWEFTLGLLINASGAGIIAIAIYKNDLKI